MTNLYVKKLCSLNPIKYKFIHIERALFDYDIYLRNWVDSYKDGRVERYQKSFNSWLETEI